MRPSSMPARWNGESLMKGTGKLMLPLPRLIFRLTMWLPNLICRSLRAQVGKPHAWFLPQGWI